MCQKALWCIALVLLPGAVQAQTGLPVAEEVAWEPLREHCRQLLAGLEAARSPLPDATVRELKALLESEPRDAKTAAGTMQKLLDAHCLVGVTINPESRVKAVRGPADAALRRDKELVFLIKVQNDGGVTHPLTVSGPELIIKEKAEAGQWLSAAIPKDAPLGGKLSGRTLEYRVIRLTARETGKREATFRFDVGQGTQDLGFRAEVPILFTVKD
jgi:hypothetical protein